jgi:hypothetical protein
MAPPGIFQAITNNPQWLPSNPGSLIYVHRRGARAGNFQHSNNNPVA